MARSSLLQPTRSLKKPVSRAGPKQVAETPFAECSCAIFNSGFVSTWWHSIQTGVTEALALPWCVTCHLLPCASQRISGKPRCAPAALHPLS